MILQIFIIVLKRESFGKTATNETKYVLREKKIKYQ